MEMLAYITAGIVELPLELLLLSNGTKSDEIAGIEQKVRDKLV